MPHAHRDAVAVGLPGQLVQHRHRVDVGALGQPMVDTLPSQVLVSSTAVAPSLATFWNTREAANGPPALYCPLGTGVAAAGAFARGDEGGAAEARDQRRRVEHRVAPARVAGRRVAGEDVADAGRVAEAVAEGIEAERGHEQRRGVAAQLDVAEVLAAQADEGVAGPEGVAVEAALLAAVGAQEGVELEEGAQAVAQVLVALEADEAGAHLAAVHALGGGGRARGLAGAGADVDQAVERDAALRLRVAGQGEDRGQRQEGEREALADKLVDALAGGLVIHGAAPFGLESLWEYCGK
ncbi:hypothetical protein Ddc_22909 [Ditylenchus destructor]|nr:hypothetical protein Ddc_22909 [Ditylenchus destructor]